MSHDDRDSDSFQPPEGEDQTLSSADWDEVRNDETMSILDSGHKQRSTPRQPTTIAGYRIIGLLGQGSMGVVWEAEQERPRRRVALKVMRREHEVDELHARLFHREAETLARLKHPNIAAIYGTGHTEGGRDYFAMELVRGETLDRWLAGRPDRLDTDEIKIRLRVFRTICNAVHYAHQRGVIHRDLKPSNIILEVADEVGSGSGSDTIESSIKVLDFGLARITDTNTAATLMSEVGAIRGTLPYMSPEQARGEVEAIDVRSDVYSLGVILYEMMAGRRPYDLTRTALVEAVRIICTEDPFPLRDSWNSSTRLDGDLETIVRMALEKEADRRYESAAALSGDVERYLSSQPILARPPSARYQLRKMVQRHRSTFLVIAAGLFALLTAVTATSWGMIRAQRAERRASESAAIAQAVNDFLNHDLLAAVVPSAMEGKGKDVSMREVLDTAADAIDAASQPGGRFGDTPFVEAAIRKTLGTTYQSLGEYRSAEPQLTRALEIRESHLERDDPAVASAMADLAYLYEMQGRYDQAISLLERAIAIWDLDPDEADAATLVAMSTLARLHGKKGESDTAEPLLRRSLELARTILGEDHPDTILAITNLANFYQERGRYTEAEPLQLEVLTTRERQFGAGSMETMRPMNNLANVYASVGRFDEAVPLWTRALELKRQYLGPEHPSTLNTLNNLAEAEEIQGHFDTAENLHREVSDARARVLGPEHPMTLWSKGRLAFSLGKLERWQQAEALANEVIEILVRTQGPRNWRTVTAEDILGTILLGQGRFVEAEELFQRLLETVEQEQPDDVFTHALVSAHLGEALTAQENWPEAEPYLLAAIPHLNPGTTETAAIIATLVELYDGWDRAEPNQGYDARANEWRTKLAKARPATE